MSKRSAADKKAGRRSALSKFFLATACSWAALWVVYVISGLPIVLLTKSIAYDPAAMTASQSTLLELANTMHAALRWVFPVLLPVVWLIVLPGAKPADDAEKKQLLKAGLYCALSCIVILLIQSFAHGVLPIDRLREGSGILNNLLIRLHAVLTAAPVGLAALALTLFARRSGEHLSSVRLHSFGKAAVIAAGAMLAVNVVAAFATVIKGTWMNIDWIVILPLAAAVIYECARSSKELREDNE